MKVSILKRMVVTGVLGTVALVGMTIPAHAQQQPQQDQQSQQDKKQQPKQNTKQPRAKQQKQQGQSKQQQPRAQQQSKQAQPRAQQQQEQAQPRAQQQTKQAQPRTQQQTKQAQPRAQQQQQASRPAQQGQRVAPAAQRSVWQQHRASNWQTEHRSWQQRGGYNGYRIPQDRYGSYFGSGHSFRIYSYPVVIYGGYPRFQYEGFWFSLVDPWPSDWSDDWYDNDDVYIEYSDDGYYLYDINHPGIGIAISVSLN